MYKPYIKRNRINYGRMIQRRYNPRHQYKHAKAVIYADSMCKNLTRVKNTHVLAFRGAKIDDISQNIDYYKLKYYKVIVLHVGTNNFSHKSVWLDYIKKKKQGIKNIELIPHTLTDINEIVIDYKVLINKIRRANRSIKILISAIIPRVFDYEINKNYGKGVYMRLKALCKETVNCEFIDTKRTFFKQGVPDSRLFAEDDLHLNKQGKQFLRDRFQQEITLNLKEYWF